MGEARHCANAAWALARWQHHCRLTGAGQECRPAVCRPALRVLANEAAGRLHDFSHSELARFLWSLGSQSCLHLSLLPPVAADMQQRTSRSPGRMSCEDIVTITMA